MPVLRFPTLVTALIATLMSLQAVSADILTQYPYQNMKSSVSWHIQQGTFYWFIPASLDGRYLPDSHDWKWGDILGSSFSPAQEASLILGSLVPAAEEGLLPNKYPLTISKEYQGKIPLPANEWPKARNNVVKEVLYTQAKDGSWPVGEKEIVGSTACGVIDLNIALRLYKERKWTPPSPQFVQNIIEAVRKGAVWLVETQNSDGSWPDQPGDKVSSGWYTVAACSALLYTLLNAGYLGLTEADFSLLAQSLNKGVLWLIQNQEPDGSFPANVMGSSFSPDTQAYIIDLLVKVYEYNDQLGLGLDKQKLLDAIKKAVWWLFAYEVPYEQIQFMDPGYSYYEVDQPDNTGGVVECYQWGPLVWMKVKVIQGPSSVLHKSIGYGPGWAFTYDDLFSQDSGLPETTVTGNVLSHALLELYYFNPGNILDTLKIPVPNPNETVEVNGFTKYVPMLVPLRKLFDPNFQFNIFATIQWFMNQQWCSTLESVSWYGGWPWPHMGVAVQSWTAAPCRVSPWATAYVMKALEAFYDMKTFYDLMSPVSPQNSNELTLSKEIVEYLSTALEQRIDKLQQDIEQVKEQLSSRIENLDNTSRQLNQSVSSIENRLKRDEQELQSLKSELSNLENEVKSNSQGLQSLNQQVSSMSTELKNLEQELSNLKSEVDQLESDVNGLKNTVLKLEKDVNDLENTVKNLGSGSQGSSSSGVSSEEVQRLEGEIQTLQSELGRIQQDLETLKSTLEALKSEEEKIKGEADANAGEIQALESTVKELERTVASLQESLKSLSDEVKGQGSDVEALKEKVGEIEKKVSDLESVVGSLSRKVTDLEARVSTGVSPTEFEGYVKEVKVLESKVEALEKEIQELKSEEKSAGGSSSAGSGSRATSPAPTPTEHGSTEHGSPVVPVVLIGALGLLAVLRTRR